MNRREFLRFLALTAAATATLGPTESIQALEWFFEKNAPPDAKGLVAVDEIMLSGMATRSLPISFVIGKPDQKIQLGINAFGGVIRWVATPTLQVICTADMFSWEISPIPGHEEVLEMHKPHSPFAFVGHVSFVDQEGKRRTRAITELRNTLARAPDVTGVQVA